MTEWDCVIVGHGLAGAALAWQLRLRNIRVLVLDRDDSVTSSKIAAGLVTPITGKRLARMPEFASLLETAIEFYRKVEKQLGITVYEESPSVRLIRDTFEAEIYHRRAANEYHTEVRWTTPSLSNEWFHGAESSFEMLRSGRLDTLAYLNHSRDHATRTGEYLVHEFQSNQLHFEQQSQLLKYPPLELRTRVLIYCQGYDAARNPFHPEIEFRAAKGEVLTCRIDGYPESRVVQGGIWLVPIAPNLVRVGATYSWEPFDHTPTAEGRAELEDQLKSILKQPYEVVGHSAAIRPIVPRMIPVLSSPRAGQLIAYFNGLGSKGTLLAPTYSAELAEGIVRYLARWN